MKNPNSTLTPSDMKNEILYMAMYDTQPSFRDFRGVEGYPRRMLEDDEVKLQKRIDSFSDTSEDEASRIAEPIITYLLENNLLLPRMNNFAFLAHDYDDKINGTDVVFGVSKNDEGPLVFSIDVATDTEPTRINEKFYNTYNLNGGVSYVKYCKHDDKRWREPLAPHIVLGMSPASLKKALEKIQLNNSNELGPRNPDHISDFIILSEFKEQLLLQQMTIGKKPVPQERRDALKAVKNEVYTALVDNLDIDIDSFKYVDETDGKTKINGEELQRAFNEKYNKQRKELENFDKAYFNIMNETERRINKYRGEKSMVGSNSK